MNRKCFNRGMALLAATWPDRAPTSDTLAAYWLVLQPLHESVFEAAIANCLRTCTFYPRPAEILARAEAALDAAGLLPLEGEGAWAEVMAANWHPNLGWNGGVSALSPLTAQAVAAIGGMGRIFNAEYHDIGFIRKEFLDFYEPKRQAEIAYSPGLMAQALPGPEPQRQLWDALVR